MINKYHTANSLARVLPVLFLICTFAGCGNSAEKLSLISADSVSILNRVSTHKEHEAVLINFWATWCAPCVKEFPIIVELSNEYRSEGLETYFISVDWDDATEQVFQFLEDQGVEGISFIKEGKDGPFIDGISEEWTGAVPFTVVFGRSSGEVVALWEGEADREKFETAIHAALVQ